LLLASSSPYRRGLLERLGVRFECARPDVDEGALSRGMRDPDAIARRLARAKAEAVGRERPHALVIGADQLVDLDGTVLGKPGSADAARAQLARLAGREHRLITAVCLLAPAAAPREALDVHRMQMRALSDLEIARYVEHDEPLDCAGSYKVEALGVSLFESISGGDFTAIEGLPLMAVGALLREAGLEIP